MPRCKLADTSALVTTSARGALQYALGCQPHVSDEQPNNPLHGVTLKAMLEDLVERHGWADLGKRIEIRCFTHDPSIRSSLKFLRRTEWARKQVEQLYLRDLRKRERNRKRNASTS